MYWERGRKPKVNQKITTNQLSNSPKKTKRQSTIADKFAENIKFRSEVNEGLKKNEAADKLMHLFNSNDNSNNDLSVVNFNTSGMNEADKGTFSFIKYFNYG